MKPLSLELVAIVSDDPTRETKIRHDVMLYKLLNYYGDDTHQGLGFNPLGGCVDSDDEELEAPGHLWELSQQIKPQAKKSPCQMYHLESLCKLMNLSAVELARRACSHNLVYIIEGHGPVEYYVICIFY